LNDSGGTVLFGIRPDGTVEGQSVSDKTIGEIAQAMDRFEPPVNVPVQRMPVGQGKEVLAISAEGASDPVPCTFESRPYERVGSTARRMSRERYEQLLLGRAHARRRPERQPAGIRPAILSRTHLSKPRNLLIAETFHRTGAGEPPGRGTNRVIEACRAHRMPLPRFEEKQGFLVVTSRAEIAALRTTLSRDEVTGQVGGQVTAQVLEFCQTARKASEIQEPLALRHRESFINNYLRALLGAGWIERTIPQKPRSRIQRYGTTAAGMEVLGVEGETMIPKDCKRLAEVDCPLAEVSRRAGRERPPAWHVRVGHTVSEREESVQDPACFPWREACLPRLQQRRRQVTKVAHYCLSADAMTPPMEVQQGSPPFGGEHP